MTETVLMTPQQVADELEETRQKVRQRIERGELKTLSVAGQKRPTYLIERREVDKLKAKLAKEAADKAKRLGAAS